MAQRDILVIGASAGGVEALQILVSGLPPSLPMAVFVVLHIPPYERSHLAPILEKAARLPVQSARDGLPITPGQIYVAVPDTHMLVEKDRVRITHGPKENRSRPAVDALFRSAAYHFGPRVIGIVLTGNLDDGTAGLWAIKDRGGLALVQSPEEALFPSMPQSALQHVAVDHVLPVSAMPSAIASLLHKPVNPEEVHPISPLMEIENRIALHENALENGSLQLGSLVPLTCPECHGSLVEVKESSLLRYRCHIGHAFSHHTLLTLMNEEIEMAFRGTLRAIEERTLLLEQLAEQQEAENVVAIQYVQLVTESGKWAERIREMIADHHRIAGLRP